MKRSFLLYSLGAAVLYVIFMLANMPAARVYAWLAPDIRHVQLHDVTGSVWEGRAASLVVKGVSLGKAKWRIRPLALLLGEVSIKWGFRSSKGYGKGDLLVAFNGDIKIEDSRLQMQLLPLKSLLPRMPIILAGDIKLQIDRASVIDGKVSPLKGSADWLGGRAVSPVASPIGNFHAEFSRQDKVLKARVTDTSGPLNLQGVLTLTEKGQYNFIADIKPRQDASAALLDALKQIARPAPNGFTLEYRGRSSLFR